VTKKSHYIKCRFCNWQINIKDEDKDCDMAFDQLSEHVLTEHPERYKEIFEGGKNG